MCGIKGLQFAFWCTSLCCRMKSKWTLKVEPNNSGNSDNSKIVLYCFPCYFCCHGHNEQQELNDHQEHVHERGRRFLLKMELPTPLNHFHIVSCFFNLYTNRRVRLMVCGLRDSFVLEPSDKQQFSRNQGHLCVMLQHTMKCKVLHIHRTCDKCFYLK